MTMLSRVGGEYKTITGGKVFAGGAWRTLAAIKGYIDGAWRDLANFTTPGTPFTVTAPDTVVATGSLSTVRSPTITVTPSGGLAPYTYAWNNGATRASTTYTVTGMAVGEERILGVSCVVTDALGYTATVNISIQFTRV